MLLPRELDMVEAGKHMPLPPARPVPIITATGSVKELPKESEKKAGAEKTGVAKSAYDKKVAPNARQQVPTATKPKPQAQPHS